MGSVDVAVVGGGPAGCAAARAAAHRGANVVVFEKGVPRADRDDPGPDSTDAAGTLNFWLELMGIPESVFPHEVVLQPVDAAEFVAPTERVTITGTGRSSWYDGFGFTFDRVAFDDWLRARAETAGATYRIDTVVDVETTLLNGTHRHRLVTRGGDTVTAEYLVLADGPHRAVTKHVISQFDRNGDITARIAPQRTNHVAYQEYRQFPPAAFDSSTLRFWWGYIPGETAYLWCFPNQDGVARIGLTRPADQSLADVQNPSEYQLLQPGDVRIPTGGTYVRRLLEHVYGDKYDVETAFPFVESRGKHGGVEGYQIASSRPIESPTQAGVAITGCAMGATSAFHEGGYHTAVRTGTLAGSLAAERRLDEYNDQWRAAIGAEICRDTTVADMVAVYQPSDWNQLFRNLDFILSMESVPSSRVAWTAGGHGAKLAFAYALRKLSRRFSPPALVRESEYDLTSCREGYLRAQPRSTSRRT